MEAVTKEYMNKIAPLFDGWNETLLWSCLQGHHGKAWADNLEAPASAQIVVGDFCFFAGAPNRELVRHIPADFASDFILMIPQNENWAEMVAQAYQKKNCERTQRYAIKKEPDCFDTEKLRSYMEGVGPDYTLAMMDEELYKKAVAQPWSRDLCSQFPTYQDYEANGMGVMALQNNMPVAGASSYTVYDTGIEIEVDTKNEYRRRGLALACASKLILECLKKGLYPSWDAHDLQSVALAEKLGYHLDREYAAYIVSDFR